MKRRTAIGLGIIVLFFAGGVLATVLVVRGLRKPPEILENSILEVRLEGEIAEGPVSHPIQGLLGDIRTNLYDLRRAINEAATDRRIRAIVITIGLNDLGWAGAEEVRGSLQHFRKAGKPIYTTIATDVIEEKDYYVALPSSRIVVNPGTGLLINGLMGEAMFFRKALDKLNVKPEFIGLKEYKSAAEPFMRKDMSPEYRESLEYVLRDLENRFVQAVVEARGKTPEQVHAFMDTGLGTASEARAQGFIDEVGYRQDIDKVLETLSGSSAEDEKEDAHRVSVRDFVKALDAAKAGGAKIGVIFAGGTIVSGESDPWNGVMGGDTVSGYIRALRKDKSIKALILRVNSPGGSAVGSDVIWREVREARSAGKPVVVSMGDVAGSGGYYISMGADQIVAQPSTLTGSIGIVFGKMNTRGLFDWLGVTFDTVKTSKNADIFSAIDSMTPEQEQRVRAWLTEAYNEFVTKAAEGRGKPFKTIEPMAHGRIWSGAQAKDRALVDTLGGMDEAIALARNLAKIPAEEKINFVIYPKRRGLLDLLFSQDSPLARVSASPLSFVETPLFKALQEAHLWMVAPEVRIH